MERKIKRGDTVTFTDTLPAGAIHLTKGRDYEVLEVSTNSTLRVENDAGHFFYYNPNRFQLSQKAPSMTNFQMILNPLLASYEIEADAPNNVLRITAGCFTGTLEEAYARANGRPCYTEPLDLIKQTATAMGISTEPEKIYTLTLTQSECDFLALLSMKVGGDRDTTMRRHNDTIREKLRIQGITAYPLTVGRIEGSVKMMSES